MRADEINKSKTGRQRDVVRRLARLTVQAVGVGRLSVSFTTEYLSS